MTTEESDETDELDLSWLIEQEKLQLLGRNIDREPNKTIRCQFIYINLDNNIDDVFIEEHDLSSSIDKKEAVLSQEKLLHILQTKKRRTENTNYIIWDLFLYNIHLEHEHIQSFIQYDEKETTENNQQFLKPVSYVNSIRIPPSIFIFHNINTLYFLFKERRNRYLPIPIPDKNIIKRTKKREIAEHGREKV